MNYRRMSAGVASVLLTVASLVGVMAQPASAATPVLADANINITFPNANEFAVCASGRLEGGVIVVGEWEFVIQGARSDGTQIQVRDSGSGPTFSPCEYINTYGTSKGAFVATLTFAGDGPSSPASEIVGLAIDEGDWTPQQNANLIIST